MGDTGFIASSPTLFLTDADIGALEDWPSAIEALRAAYRRPEIEGATPERSVATTSSGWLRVMPSAPSGARLAGSKTIAAAITNGRVGYLVSLFDQETAALVALVDGNRLTGIRTAATAAVAVDALTPSRPLRLGIIGSGFEARAQLRASARVRTFDEVRVFSPTAANREAFADEMSAELEATVIAVPSAEAAADGADLVVCAARSSDESPTLRREWVDDEATVVSVGSTTRSQRELDTALIGASGLIIADALEEVLYDSGDMIAARQEGRSGDDVTISLHELLATGVPPHGPGPVIYKSTGSGFQDIVLAEDLYWRAIEDGAGTPLPVGILTIEK